MSNFNPNNPPGGPYGPGNIFGWLVQGIQWLSQRLNGVSSSGGGGTPTSLPIGTPVTGGTANNGILYENASGNVAEGTTTMGAAGVILNGTTNLLASTGTFSVTFPEKSGTVAMTSDVGGVTIGSAVSGGASYRLLVEDFSSNLAQTAVTTVYDGTNIQTITQAPGDNSLKVATTAYADNAGIYTAQVPLSSAQILNLFTTPVQLVAAPGSGKIIVPLSIIVDYTFVTTAYVSNTTLQIYENSDRSNPTWGPGISSILTATSSQIRSLYNNAAANGTTVVQYADNQPLMITTATNNPTTGDGTAKLTVLYKIVTR